ncbi:hypothetical protein M406DRAFT_324884 [Cryphonectria parasitica EP155]|uniref:Uncharacterized protein n=1 Tax=Cryphonectria parasitica (strain ATCC 38755 / EP155) TaxID=660469 RepID=A0A9P4XSQ3_CRYP1|nr:uncharacterized protein M406DRAFT_324884 [Cryphonectria parasitica EP155]KAF3760020.1 hypothetical protein M406DRAFT_324884 [Cryphonectria parasitica EP155]
MGTERGGLGALLCLAVKVAASRPQAPGQIVPWLPLVLLHPVFPPGAASESSGPNVHT